MSKMAPQLSLPLDIHFLGFLPVSGAGFNDYLLMNRLWQEGWVASSKTRLLKSYSFVLSILLDQHPGARQVSSCRYPCHRDYPTTWVLLNTTLIWQPTPWQTPSEWDPDQLWPDSWLRETEVMNVCSLKLWNLGITDSNHTIVSFKKKKKG